MHETDARRVVAGVSGSLGSLAALHRAAAEARRTGAEVWAVLVWQLPGGEFGPCSSPCPPPLSERGQAAGQRLRAALHTAFGSAGPGIPFRCLVARGTPGRTLVEIADRGEDLLAIATGHHGPALRTLLPSVPRYCVTHAACGWAVRQRHHRLRSSGPRPPSMFQPGCFLISRMPVRPPVGRRISACSPSGLYAIVFSTRPVMLGITGLGRRPSASMSHCLAQWRRRTARLRS